MIPMSPVWAATGAILAPDNTKISEGWTLGEKPPHEFMNWFMNEVANRLNHVFLNGVPQWDAGTQYPKDSVVLRSGFVWRAVSANQNSAPAVNNSNWRRVTEDASNLTTGTVPAARMSGNYSFTGLTLSGPLSGNTGAFSGAVTAASFSGVGSALTALNASQISLGTLPAARLSGSYSFGNLTLTGNINVGGNATVGGILSGSTIRATGSQVIGNGSNLVLAASDGGGLTGDRVYVKPTGASGSAAGQVSFGTSGTTFSADLDVNGVIRGNGSGLTELNANRLTAGTVSNDRMNGAYSFSGLALSAYLTVEGTATFSGNVGVSGSLFGLGTIRGGNAVGSAVFNFEGQPGTGMGRAGTDLLAFYAGGSEIIRMNGSNGNVNLIAGGSWGGRGSGLTNLNASAIDAGVLGAGYLPENAAANVWVGARFAGLAYTGIGQLAFAADTVDRSTAYGAERPGSSLAPASPSEDTGDLTGSLPGTWRCLGKTFSGGDRDRRTTLWQRVS